MIVREGLARRITQGFGISSAIIAVTLIGQILTVPVYLQYWETEVYGEWLVITSTVALLSLLNLGIQTYAINLLIEKYLTNQIDSGRRILQCALLLYCLLGGVAVV